MQPADSSRARPSARRFMAPSPWPRVIREGGGAVKARSAGSTWLLFPLTFFQFLDPPCILLQHFSGLIQFRVCLLGRKDLLAGPVIDEDQLIPFWHEPDAHLHA